MNIVPIVYAFDNNLMLPACVCIFSLMSNAKEDTFYDIFILHSAKEDLEHDQLDSLISFYPNCKIHYREVDDVFDKAFEVRGITTAAYYRLLIPELIPEYDKIIYSDVDVIFREDLSDFYLNTDLDNYYLAGVNSLAYMVPSYARYYKKIGLDAKTIIYSGNLLFNSIAIRKAGLVNEFKRLARNSYLFQDMDIINIACKGHIKYVAPHFCLSTIIQWAIYTNVNLSEHWEKEDIEYALQKGIIHYNGQKPWRGYCLNFDIWWEYYRKSPFFNEKFYFDFFYAKLNELDQLSFWKRIKILIRYFVYGKKKLM